MVIRSLAIFLALAVAMPAFAAERRYTVTDFDRIQVDGPYQVTLATGRASSARASGSPAALDALTVAVEGRTLRIRRDQSAWGADWKRGSGQVSVILTTQNLRSAVVNGAGSLAVDKAAGLRVEAAVAGSGELKIASLDTDALAVSLLGAGRIGLSGKTKSLRAEIHGSGSLEGETLVSSDAQIFADTAGPIRVGASRSANIVSSAAGDVEILGDPSCTVKVTGTGSVRCGRD
jgi:hypothetical protein